MEQKIELKPCPFCGVVPNIRTYRYKYGIRYYVKCGNRDCDTMPHTFMWEKKQHAIDDWNRRGDNG